MAAVTSSFLLRLVVVLGLALAFASSGFGHHLSGSHRAPSDPDLELFLASGGALSDICAGDHAPQMDVPQSCEMCRLVDASLIPPAPIGPPMELSGVACQWRAQSAVPQSGGVLGLKGARGPPAV